MARILRRYFSLKRLHLDLQAVHKLSECQIAGQQMTFIGSSDNPVVISSINVAVFLTLFVAQQLLNRLSCQSCVVAATNNSEDYKNGGLDFAGHARKQGTTLNPLKMRYGKKSWTRDFRRTAEPPQELHSRPPEDGMHSAVRAKGLEPA